MERDARGVLLAMKENIVRGWAQGDLWKEEGVCIYGAIIGATGLKPRSMICDSLVMGRGYATNGQLEAPIETAAYVLSDLPVVEEVSLLLAETAGVSLNNLALWNDAPERTQGEIVDLIDKALQALPEGKRAEELVNRQ